jgi:hypothetical protein
VNARISCFIASPTEDAEKEAEAEIYFPMFFLKDTTKTLLAEIISYFFLSKKTPIENAPKDNNSKNLLDNFATFALQKAETERIFLNKNKIVFDGFAVKLTDSDFFPVVILERVLEIVVSAARYFPKKEIFWIDCNGEKETAWYFCRSFNEDEDKDNEAIAELRIILSDCLRTELARDADKDKIR